MWRTITQDDEGFTYAVPFQAIRGKDCTIYLEARPHHCDRGNFVAKIDADGGTGLARELDHHDGWPRFYFDEARAKLEIEAWLKKRGQWIGDDAC